MADLEPYERPTGPDAAVAPAQFRDAMRLLPGGVAIITAGRGGDRSGMTVTSVSSLSVEPPTIVVCINKDASTWPLVQKYKAFGVSVPTAGQRGVAERFSGRGGAKGADRYVGANWIALVTGTSLLRDALAIFDCDVEDAIARHSHYLVIGRVRAVRHLHGGPALLYWQGRYETVGSADPELSVACG